MQSNRIKRERGHGIGSTGGATATSGATGAGNVGRAGDGVAAAFDISSRCGADVEPDPPDMAQTMWRRRNLFFGDEGLYLFQVSQKTVVTVPKHLPLGLRRLYSIMAPATYEFTSFRAMQDATHVPPCPRSDAAAASDPWLPPGKNKSHAATRIPSRKDREAAAARLAEEERSRVAAALYGTECAFGRLESRIERVTNEYEQHVLAATAASILVTKRLQQLGVAVV